MPSNDNNTLWFQRSLNKQAANQARMAIARTGRALPCVVTAVYGSLVTVSFQVQSSNPYSLPQLTIPKAESQWMRAPTQVGDAGITVPADTSIGGINGDGAGVAQVNVAYGNLSALIFVPVSSSAFPSSPDVNKAWINGINGVVISDTAQKNIITVSANPSITSTVNTNILGPITTKLDGVSNTITHELSSVTGPVTSTIDGINNKISHIVPNALGPITHLLDGANNAITHELSAVTGPIKTIVDGAGNAISHIVPSGGMIGLGALPSSLPTSAAAITNAGLSAFQTNLLTARLNDLIALITAMEAAAVPNAGAVLAQLASLAPIPVPSGSSIVRMAG